MTKKKQNPNCAQKTNDRCFCEKQIHLSFPCSRKKSLLRKNHSTKETSTKAQKKQKATAKEILNNRENWLVDRFRPWTRRNNSALHFLGGLRWALLTPEGRNTQAEREREKTNLNEDITLAVVGGTQRRIAEQRRCRDYTNVAVQFAQRIENKWLLRNLRAASLSNGGSKGKTIYFLSLVVAFENNFINSIEPGPRARGFFLKTFVWAIIENREIKGKRKNVKSKAVNTGGKSFASFFLFFSSK